MGQVIPGWLLEADMRLYVVRETQWDLTGEPTDVNICAGPYKYTDAGNEECLAALAELERRNPTERYRVIGDTKRLEVRADKH